MSNSIKISLLILLLVLTSASGILGITGIMMMITTIFNFKIFLFTVIYFLIALAGFVIMDILIK